MGKYEEVKRDERGTGQLGLYQWESMKRWKETGKLVLCSSYNAPTPFCCRNLKRKVFLLQGKWYSPFNFFQYGPRSGFLYYNGGGIEGESPIHHLGTHGKAMHIRLWKHQYQMIICNPLYQNSSTVMHFQRVLKQNLVLFFAPFCGNLSLDLLTSLSCTCFTYLIISCLLI